MGNASKASDLWSEVVVTSVKNVEVQDVQTISEYRNIGRGRLRSEEHVDRTGDGSLHCRVFWYVIR